MESRDRITLVFGALIILVAAVLFALIADAPHVALLTAAGVVWAMLLRRPVAVTSRAVIYALVGVAVLTVLEDQVIAIRPDRFFVIPGQLLGPGLLYLGTALLLFPQDPAATGGVMAAALGVCMVSGNRMISTPPLVRLAGLTELLPRFTWWYAAAVALEMLLILGLLRRLEPRHEPSPPRRAAGRGWRMAVTGLAVFLAVGGVLGLRWSAFVYDTYVSRFFGQMFDAYLSRRHSWLMFGDEVDLRQGAPYLSHHDEAIALRAISHDAPGYLRGRSYHLYGNGKWTAPVPHRPLASSLPGGYLAYAIFQRPETEVPRPAPAAAAPAGRAIAIYLANQLPSDVLLATGGAFQFEVTARGLAEDANGSLVPDNWERRAGYLFRAAGDDAYPAPVPPPVEDYLEVPAGLRQALEPVVAQMRAREKPAGSDWDRVRSVRRFLAARCSYALGIRFVGTADPVVQFLVERRKGHCELFATAAALLLRMQGVPTRYVTGFVCAERHPSGAYWVARLSTAHAWAEAYLADEHRWVRVEATPDAGVPAISQRSGFSSWQAGRDRAIFAWQRFFTWLKQGYMAELIFFGLYSALHGIAWLFTAPWRAILSVLVLGLGAAWFIRRRRRRRRHAQTRYLTPSHQALCQEWRRVEKRLRRRGLRRDPAWTLREFAAHAAETADAATGTAVRGLVAEYERLRYRSAPPDPGEIARFAALGRESLQA